MSEAAILNPETAVARTPLSAVLERDYRDLPLTPHGGAQTIAAFSTPRQELNAAIHSAAVSDLGYRTRIQVTGEDRLRWANGMMSNAIQTLPTGRGNYNFILNAQGRIQGDGYIYHLADSLFLDTDRSQAPRLFNHLDHFIIMDDVELKRLDDQTNGLALIGPKASAVLDTLGLDASSLPILACAEGSLAATPVTLVHAYSVLVPRFELWFSPENTRSVWETIVKAGAEPIGLNTIETLRVLEGLPQYGVDITDRHLPQETSQTRALNFTKGCYLGQEIVERIRSRATVHRSIRHFSIEGSTPAAPVELRAADDASSDPQTTANTAIGQLTSMAHIDLPGFSQTLAIGSIRNEVLERKSRIEYAGGTAKVLSAPPSLP